MFRIVVVALVVVGLTVGPINAAHAADPVTVAASGGSMLIESRTASGAKVLTHYSMSGATVVGGPTRAGFTARHGALLSPKARVALSATKAASGWIGLGLATGELLWFAYRSANPPPDWDWDTGTDPNLIASTTAGTDELVAYAGINIGVRNFGDTWSSQPLTHRRGPPLNEPYEFISEGYAYQPWLAVYFTNSSGSLTSLRGVANGFVGATYGGDLSTSPQIVSRSFDNNGDECGQYTLGNSTSTVQPDSAYSWYLIGTSATIQWCRDVGLERTEIVARHWSISAEDYVESTLAVLYPQGSTIAGNRARVVADVTCTHEGGGSDSNLQNVSDWYDDHDDRPLLPTVHCPTQTVLAGADYYVEYEDGTKRYIIGGPADDADRGGQAPRNAYTDTPATFFSFVPQPAPSYVPSGEEALWDDCADPASGVDCTLTLYNVEQQREAAPATDVGWHLQPDRDTVYECRLTHPTLGTSVLGLEECGAFVWEQSPEGYTTTAPAPTVVPNPASGDDPEVPPATLPATTPGGQPTTAPQPDQSCMNARQEEGGISSWLVFAGVACAFEWAYVPSPEFMAELQVARDGMANKPPMGYATAAADWFSAFGDLPDACLTIDAPVEGYGSYTVADSCGSHPVTDAIIGYRPFLLVAFYGAFLAPLAWWAWRTYAPGAGGST